MPEKTRGLKLTATPVILTALMDIRESGHILFGVIGPSFCNYKEYLMEIMDIESFFQTYPKEMYYVGFMKSAHAWFPLCFLSDPGQCEKLDSLFVSSSYPIMIELVKDYAQKVPQIEDTCVQYLLREEVRNILKTYSLKHIGLATPLGDSSGCDCGCGCG